MSLNIELNKAKVRDYLPRGKRPLHSEVPFADNESSISRFSAPMRSWQTVGKPSVNSASEDSSLLLSIPKSKYCIGIDYLEITITGEFVQVNPEDPDVPLVNSSYEVPFGKLPGRFKLFHNKRVRGNSHFKYGLEVLFIPVGAKITGNKKALINEYRIGKMASIPHSGSNCQKMSSIFQPDNHVLYQENFWDIVDALFAALEAEVRHVTRLDIALDGHDLLKPFDEFYKDKMAVDLGFKAQRDFDKIGKAEYKVDTNGLKDGRVVNFYVGSLKSSKSLNGYRKGDRIPFENKYYIPPIWKKAGITESEEDWKEIERIEVRHRRESVDELNLIDENTGEVLPFDWRRLRQSKYLVGLMKASLNKFYGFKKVNPNDQDKSRWEDVETIDWANLDSCRIVRIGRAKSKSQIWRAKHAAIKIIHDALTEDYLQEAVRKEITSVPSYRIVEDYGNDIATEMAGIWPELSEDRAKIIVGKIVDQLVPKISSFVATWASENVPESIAWAMAEMHHVAAYIDRRIKRERLPVCISHLAYGAPSQLQVAAA
ncbi:MAG: hypothetical protein AAF433_14010 [Bacteroidota bacterium]